MSDFVEECRREWKRLGVPDAVANEMATDLAADLAEAEAEGASAEDVLGIGTFDPRSFAAAWAFAQGVAERPSSKGQGPRRWLVLAALAVFALLAIAGGVLAVVDASSTSETRDALPAGAVWVSAVSPDGMRIVTAPAPPPDGGPLFVLPAPPVYDPIRIVRGVPVPPEARMIDVDADDPGFDARTLGYVFLAVGLAGAVAVWLGQAVSAADPGLARPR